MNSKKSGSRIVKVSNDWKKDGKALTYLEWKKQVFSHPIMSEKRLLWTASSHLSKL